MVLISISLTNDFEYLLYAYLPSVKHLFEFLSTFNTGLFVFLLLSSESLRNL